MLDAESRKCQCPDLSPAIGCQGLDLQRCYLVDEQPGTYNHIAAHQDKDEGRMHNALLRVIDALQ